MKRFYIIACLLGLSGIMGSCKKYLQEQSPTEITPKTAESLNELLLGSGYLYLSPALFRYSTLMDDNVDNVTFQSGVKDFYYLYTWQPNYTERAGSTIMLQKGGPWQSAYTLIEVCNVVLDQLAKVSGTDSVKGYVEGQARLLRAYYYFNLINFYGKPYSDVQSNPETDPGVPLMTSSAVSLDQLPRSTVAKVYEQIQNDLAKGIELMSKYPGIGSVYRISATAGRLLASRVQLHMGNWQAAADNATQVIASKAVLANLNNWGAPNQFNNPVVGVNNPEAIWAFSSSADLGLANNMYCGLSANLRALYEPGDLRSGIYFNGNTSLKIWSYTSNTTQLFRVSEAWLNRAEAYARLFISGNAGARQKALDDLNNFRKNRIAPAQYTDLSITDPQALLSAVMNEKRKEFFLEEAHRWFDLRRNGMPAIEHVYYETATDRYKYVLQQRDPAYTMQISDETIKRNSNLVPNPVPAERTGTKL